MKNSQKKSTKQDIRGRAVLRQQERVEELLKERNRLVSEIAAGVYNDNPEQLARARANVKSVNYMIRSYRAGKRA